MTLFLYLFVYYLYLNVKKCLSELNNSKYLNLKTLKPRFNLFSLENI